MGRGAAALSAARLATYSEYPFSYFSSLDFASSTADVAPAINAALSSISASGGGVLVLPRTVNYVTLSEPIVLQSSTGMKGAGMFGTVMKLASGVNSDAITNYVSPDGTLANAQFISLSDFQIDGNKSNQSAGGCVYLNTYPQFTAATEDFNFDSYPRIQNVLMNNGKDGGFAEDGRSEARLLNCVALDCDKYGFTPSFDSALIGCTSSNAGKSGFLIQSTQVTLVGCKSFYSGQTDATSPGLKITADGCSVNGFQSQDNQGAGVYVGSNLNTITGLVCDSNSTSSAGTYPGIEIDGDDNHVQAICFERKADTTNSYQTHAIKFTSGINNDVRIKHAARGGATISDAVMSGSVVDGNRLLVNNEGGLDSDHTFATSYDSWAYDGHKRFTLTDNVTINAPLSGGYHEGSEIEYVMTQDSTGGRTMTFNAAFKTNWTPSTTANKTNVIRFKYLNGSWWQIYAATGL